MKIKLMTRQPKEINGGGSASVVRMWNLGPRTLLRAFDALIELRKWNILGYGNIGCGSSWIEIAGVEYSELPFDLPDAKAVEDFYHLNLSSSPQENAKRWIQEAAA